MKKYFIIDFDSTFVQSEGLEELAEVVFKGKTAKEKIMNKIKEITKLGMEGKIGFSESLQKRLSLLRGTKLHINQIVRILKKKISISIRRNRQFFKNFNNDIYIVSGGFRELILPIVKSYGIGEDHVFANTFVLSKSGRIVGLDSKNPMSKDNGKVAVVKKLKLKGEGVIIGDGYSDYQIRAMGVVKHFVAFTENVYREVVVSKADHVAPSFDEFLYVNKLPMSISYPKSRIKVILLENINNLAVSLFEKEGYQVEHHAKSLTNSELLNKLTDVKILGIRSRINLDAAILKKGQKLLAVGAYCIGTNQIDLPSATARGVAVFNAPYSNTRSVVEMIIGEIIMLSRGIFDKSKNLHYGIWDKSAKNSYEVRGKSLGIIGYGNIGSQLSILAEAIGLKVYFYDSAEKLPLGNAVRCKSLKELLNRSDIVTVHVDGNRNNLNLIGEKEINQMKDGAFFLNASRGFTVDIGVLSKNLKSGKLKGAAIDVFPDEPKDTEDRFFSQLQNLPNVILTPHIGGSTIEAQKNIAEFVTAKIIDYINTGNSYLSVNFPQINLPNLKNAHRLLHLHDNVPGILAKINKILAGENVNILGQYLKTNDNFGYVITDINKKYDIKILKKLEKIPNTIRFRVLY